MKVNGRRNKRGPGAWILGASAWQFLQRVTASSRRARRNRMHTNACDRALAPNTGSTTYKLMDGVLVTVMHIIKQRDRTCRY